MDSQNRPSPQELQAPQQPQLHQQLPPSQAAPPRAQLPPLPSLQHLKKQAKHLLAACQGGDPAELARLQRWFPEQSTPFTLSQAQLALAREYGSASWGQLRHSVLTALVERLAVRHWSEWRAAHAARASLEQSGDDGVLAVIEGLSHSEPRVRRGAADFLARNPDPRSAPELAELALQDPVPYVRRLALIALKSRQATPSPQSLPVPAAPIAPLSRDLVPLLDRAVREDPSPRVRAKVVGLGLETSQLVRVAREDPSQRVRLLALSALGGRRDSALARQTLEAALLDPHPDVQHTAHKALRRLSPEYRELVARRAREANQAAAGADHSAAFRQSHQ